MVSVCTGDFGTSTRHPPRERMDSTISNFLPREGVAALPYTESLTSAEHLIIASNGTFPFGRTRRSVPTRKPSRNATYKPKVNQPIKRSAVSARGRKHQRPITAYGCVSEVQKGALVEAGGRYRAKPNGMDP